MSRSMVWKVWRGFSFFGDCESYYGDRESGWTAFDAAEAGEFPECCTWCYQHVNFTAIVPASTEYHKAVQALTDESVSDETPHFTSLTVTRDPA